MFDLECRRIDHNAIVGARRLYADRGVFEPSVPVDQYANRGLKQPARCVGCDCIRISRLGKVN